MRARLLAVLFAISLLAACQRGGKKVVAVIPKANSHVFWVAVQSGAVAAGKEFNLDVEWNGPASETDYTRQIQIVDSMTARHVDGIAVAATERKALVQAVERAHNAKIPVVLFDSGLDSESYDAFIATDNYAAGGLGARKMAELLNGKGKIAILKHATGSVSTEDRERGFMDVLAKEFPGIQIVATQYGQSDRAKARSAAENFLTAYPDLNGIFGSAEPSSVGAALAVDARGMKGKVHVVGFDADDTLVKQMESGVVDALVVQDPYKMGFETVRLLAEKIQGKTVPRRTDLSARVIVKSDLASPDVQKLLHPTAPGLH